jgi:iron complex outermembrane receptor protein
MKFLKSLLILGLFSTAQILISADEELVVTGSYLKDKTLESSPVDVLSAADLENLNISSLAEIGKYIHTSSGSHFQSDSLEGTDQGMANINLRGLNLSATLVMINSKRNTLAGLPAESGDSYVDINLIPQIAVERIEVLKEGATSLYGSDAIAGVVNFLTYNNFDGGKLKFSNQKTQHYGQNERKLEFLYGNSLNDINLVLGLEILNRSSLPSKKIEGISELGVSMFGNSFEATVDGTTGTGAYAGNVYSSGEVIQDANCLQNGGIPDYLAYGNLYCGFLYGDRFNITNDEDHEKIYLNANRFFEKYSFSSTFIFSSVDVNDNPQSPSYPALSFPMIAAGNAGSPFNNPVKWNGRPLGASSPSPLSPKEIDQFHFSTNFDIDLNKTDKMKLAITHSEHENSMSRPDTINSRLIAALNNTGGPNSDLTWNIFDSSQNSETLKNYIKGSEDSVHQAKLSIFDLLYEGQINNSNYVVGFQAGLESLDVTWNDLARVEFDADGKMTKSADLLFLGGGSNVNSDREKYAVFSEFYPQISNDLDIKISARFEKIGDESSFDPKISVKKYINNNLILRGSLGTSFAMPSLGQLYSANTSLSNVSGTFIRVSKVGDPDLKPQSSTNSNFGIIYLYEDRKISLDYWQINYKDRLTVESAKTLYDANPNNPIFTYNSGVLFAANVKYINEEKTDLSGIDFSFESGKYNSSFGQFDYKINGTYLMKYETTQGGTSIERAGRFNHDIDGYSLPKYKVNLFALLEKNLNKYTFNARYVGGYDNHKKLLTRAISVGGYSNKVDSSLMYDLGYKRDFKNKNLKYNLNFSILNLTDEDAPKVNSQPEFSYDPRQIDPRGRIFAFGIELIL